MIRNALLRPCSGAGLAACALVLTGCGDSGTTGPNPASLEILPISGNGQVALAGSLLPEAFVVRVQNASSQRPAEGINVSWTVTSGDGATVSPPVSATDPAGVAMARLTLGPALGEYRVEATFSGHEGSPISFTASAMLTPTLTSVSDGPVSAGTTVSRNPSSTSMRRMFVFKPKS